MTDAQRSLRECPTPTNGHEPLIAHQISEGTCGQRQAKHYHKCAACQYAAGLTDVVLPALQPLARDLSLEPAGEAEAPAARPEPAAKR